MASDAETGVEQDQPRLPQRQRSSVLFKLTACITASETEVANRLCVTENMYMQGTDENYSLR
jgi:hypothetical protein